MPFDDLPYLEKPAIAQERPFEGGEVFLAMDEADGRDLMAIHLFPELVDWLPLLQSLALSAVDAAQWALLARQNGTDFQSELLASGSIGEDKFYRALADDLGLGYLRVVDPERLVVRADRALSLLQGNGRHIPIQLVESRGPTSCVMAPEGAALVKLREILRDRPEIADRLKVVAPGQLRAALIARLKPTLAEKATSSLFDRFPALSARIVANARQGSVCGAAMVALPAIAIVAPAQTWLGLHFFFSLFFLACVGLRMAAIRSALPHVQSAVAPVPADELPVYSVLVALYKEAAVVPDLLAALDRLSWPKSKLEIKLVCEEDDTATLAALRASPLPVSTEIIEVPVFGPRTKPKALAYALPLVSGEFVALYDAEDQPHPMQLMQAWQKFEASAPDVACVQAPLEISNRRGGAVSLMFAFEYAALFRGLLPWLAARQLLLPLGGTSNHFRGIM